MAARWGMSLFGSLLILSMGCRTTQPVVKPDTTAEVLRTAPQEARYDSSAYPKLAFDNNQDPSKRYALDTKSGIPSRGSMGPGAGGMGGMR